MPVDLESFDYLDTAEEGWIRLRTDSLWGFYHPQKNLFIAPQLEWAENFTNGLALVRKDSQFTYLNIKGKQSKKRFYTKAYPYSERTAPVQHNGRFGYIKPKGKWTIRPDFDWALPFEKHQAIVVKNSLYGIIDHKGRYIIRPEYDEIRPYAENLYLIRNANRFGLIDRTGKIILPVEYKNLQPIEGQFSLITAMDGRKGMIDFAGNTVLPIEFTDIGKLVAERFRYVHKDDRQGLIDSLGNLIVPPVYQQLGYPSENRIVALKDGNWGYLDFEGQEKIPFIFEQDTIRRVSRNFLENRAWATKDGHFLLIDTSGYILEQIPYGQVDHAYAFRHGRALVSRDSTQYHRFHGFVNTQGKVVVPVVYTSAMSFNEHGIGWVGFSKNNDGFADYWLIDTSGYRFNDKPYRSLEYVGDHYIRTRSGKQVFLDSRTGLEITPDFENIEQRKNRDDKAFYVVRETNCNPRLMDSKMQEIIPPIYESFGSMDRTLLWVRKYGHWGITDYKGRLRIPSLYDSESGWFKGGLISVSKNGQRGVIDTSGREIVPFRYNNVYLDENYQHILAHGKDKTDLFDFHGRPISVGEWDYIGGFYHQEFSYVRKDGKMGIVDAGMNIICAPIYNRIGRFEMEDGMAWVVQNQKVGYMDREFRVVIPIVYDGGDVFANGMARVKKDGEILYLNRSGERIYPTPEQINAYDKVLERIKDGYRKLDFSS